MSSVTRNGKSSQQHKPDTNGREATTSKPTVTLARPPVYRDFDQWQRLVSLAFAIDSDTGHAIAWLGDRAEEIGYQPMFALRSAVEKFAKMNDTDATQELVYAQEDDAETHRDIRNLFHKRVTLSDGHAWTFKRGQSDQRLIVAEEGEGSDALYLIDRRKRVVLVAGWLTGRALLNAAALACKKIEHD